MSDGSRVPFTAVGLGGNVTFESLVENGPAFSLFTLEFDLNAILSQESTTGEIQLTVEDLGFPSSTSLGSIGNPEMPFANDPLFAISPSGGTATQPTAGESYSIVLGTSLPGDFNGDGVVSPADIDLLSNAIQLQTSIPTFDLNNDATLNLEDHSYLIRNILATSAGDADLDRDVDFPDFLVLSASFGSVGGWSKGDFNADGFVDFSDFLALSGNFGSPSVAPVPEPDSGFMVFVAILILAAFRASKATYEDRPTDCGYTGVSPVS